MTQNRIDADNLVGATASGIFMSIKRREFINMFTGQLEIGWFDKVIGIILRHFNNLCILQSH